MGLGLWALHNVLKTRSRILATQAIASPLLGPNVSLHTGGLYCISRRWSFANISRHTKIAFRSNLALRPHSHAAIRRSPVMVTRQRFAALARFPETTTGWRHPTPSPSPIVPHP
eukprot:7062339-Pyramimonas_sp.AAC.1